MRLQSPVMAAKKQRHSGFVSQANERNKVRKIGNLVGQLISRRGYASVMSNGELRGSIQTAVGPSLAESFQVGNLRAGVLHLLIADSVSLQEFNFRKRAILKQLQIDVPDRVKDLRFRVG